MTSRTPSRARTVSAIAFAIFFVLAGINHFANPAFYLRIIPPYLPAHALINVLSGLAELAIGALMVVPRMRRLAGWAAIALLVAVFPANLYVYANHAQLFPDVPPLVHLLRLPLQAGFIAWAYFAAGLGRRRTVS